MTPAVIRIRGSVSTIPLAAGLMLTAAVGVVGCGSDDGRERLRDAAGTAQPLYGPASWEAGSDFTTEFLKNYSGTAPNASGATIKLRAKPLTHHEALREIIVILFGTKLDAMRHLLFQADLHDNQKQTK